MVNFELPKSIEARKLNPRSGLPTKEGWVTVPYGAVLTNLEADREYTKFKYLGELYHSLDDVLQKAFRKTTVREPEPEAAAAADPALAAGPAPAPEDTGPKLRWEAVPSSRFQTARAKVPGGWLVSVGSAVTYYPDPEHAWDPTSSE